LTQVITLRHIDNMNKVLLATSMMVGYGYLMEAFMNWYSGNEFERFGQINRMTGHYAPVYWLLIFCNVLVPQLFWSKRMRTHTLVTWFAALFVNIGMWSERFVIVIVSLTRDFIPSSWANYAPTWVDLSLLFGTIGFFGMLFLLFLRFIPAVSASEVKELQHELSEEERVAEAA
jgi:Ni/Fe-hydrogenase subunit HybB-like protein